MNLKERVERDEKNAVRAKELAISKLRVSSVSTGIIELDPRRWGFNESERDSFGAISNFGFHAMAEVEIERRDGKVIKLLWYANERTKINSPLVDGRLGTINVLTWTHPGLQAALTEDLHHWSDLSESGFSIVAVRAEARARLETVFPKILGFYEPGGSVGAIPLEAKKKGIGLKAVKLGMTREQSRAFRSRMSGLLIVTGAPGSGKTTVAFQRVRFLLDQQDERAEEEKHIDYDVGDTRIFLCNRNLIQFSKRLLQSELEIQNDVVEYVPDFISKYVNQLWKWRFEARLRRRALTPLEARARDAFFSRCTVKEIKECWQVYENQIAIRLTDRESYAWEAFLKSNGVASDSLKETLGLTSRHLEMSHGRPAESEFRMDTLYSKIAAPYETVRESLKDRSSREIFDEQFGKWLFYVYDPLDSIKVFFGGNKYPGEVRIKQGTAGRAKPSSIIEGIFDDWGNRIYGQEELPWVGFLLRFALPEEEKPTKRFRDMPDPLRSVSAPWSHVVIDEAQDLSAPEAILTSSLVHKYGALTISADFHQRVSPAHGIDDSEAIKLGSPFFGKGVLTPFRFSENKRQSQELSRFLKAFYEKVFGEVPPFDVDKGAINAAKPRLVIGSSSELRKACRQIYNILQKTDPLASVAVLQINDNDQEFGKLQELLRREHISFVTGNELSPNDTRWVAAHVEQIKGLEYDTCLVFGLDHVDLNELDYGKNRAYVALSRPTRRLIMLCDEFPKLLRGIPQGLYERDDRPG